MRFTRTSIAAAVTVAALGLLAAVALASGGHQTTTAPAPAAETDPPAQVRTETVRRTVHRDAPARAASSDDDGTTDQGPGDAPRTPFAPVRDAGVDDNSVQGSANRGPGSVNSGGGDDGANHDVGDDHGGDDDGAGHDVGDDHGGSGHGGSGHGGGGDDD